EHVSTDSLAALERQLPTEEMNELVTEMLASTLLSLGLFRNGTRTIADLRLDKPPAPYLERWLSTTVSYLHDQRWLADDGVLTRDVRTMADLWAAWEANRSAWATNNPNRQAHMALLDACLKALPKVLGGTQRATDVLFPNSS